MAETLRSLVPSKVRVVSVIMTGAKSARVDYEELLNGEIVNEGTADCFDVDSVEFDPETRCLTGKSILSQSGEVITTKRGWDKTGLGRRRR